MQPIDSHPRSFGRRELIRQVAVAIAEMEGFFITAEQAKARRIPYPTVAQINANPGNIRRWRGRGGAYPTRRGYVDFVAWATKLKCGTPARDAALAEGWRILEVLVGQYVDGRYTNGRPPSFEEMFRVYAPAADANHPDQYAQFVATRLGARPDQRLIDLIQ